MIAFIIKSMQSIASHYREKRGREIADGGAARDKAKRGPAVVFAAAALNPEEMLIEQETNDTVDAIYTCFEGDKEAQSVVRGWSTGYRGKELRDYVGVDQAGLDYTIKRIRRAMTKRYPRGWKKS